MHEDTAGQWFLEAGFGDLDRHKHAFFPDFKAAQNWITDQLRSRGGR
jgi:hypothetical protein